MAPTDTFTIIHVGNAIESGFVKSLLEEYGIPAFLRDEIMGSIAPWYIAPGGVGAVKVLIARSDYERAKAILDEFLDDEDVAREKRE